jgi:hypothetical protein
VGLIGVWRGGVGLTGVILVGVAFIGGRSNETVVGIDMSPTVRTGCCRPISQQ